MQQHQKQMRVFINGWNGRNGNEEMEDFMKIVKSLDKWGLSIKGVSKTIEKKICYFKRYIRC